MELSWLTVNYRLQQEVFSHWWQRWDTRSPRSSYHSFVCAFMSYDRLKTLRNYTPAEREKEDTINEFFIQMAAIEQSHFEREEKRLEKEDSARKKEKQ